MVHRGGWRSVGLALTLLACATPPPKPVKKEALGLAPLKQSSSSPKSAGTGSLLLGKYRPRSLAEYEQLASRITTEVSVTRGLKLKRVLELELLQDESFDRALEAARGGTLTPAQERAFLAQVMAFGIADVEALEKQKDQPGFSGFIGLYDPDTQKLFVRVSSASNDLAQEAQMQATIAHEVQHALQHQHFGMVDFTRFLGTFTDWDRLRAMKAVYEGDAELARALFLAGGDDPARAIAEHAAVIRAMSRHGERIKEVGFGTNVNETSPFLRSTIVFPYAQGSVFLAKLYETGGMELVNRVFAHPPVSTEQVLHPHKYLEGDAPVPIPPPRVPAGYQLITQGRMGELGVDLLLEQCADAHVSHPAAEGWGGDAFTISQSQTGQLALSWNTAWDSENDAKEFASALESLKSCWKKTTAPSKGWSINGRHEIQRRGTVVAIVRGLSGTEGAELAAMTAGAPAKLRPVPPLGRVRLHEEEQPREPVAVEQRGVLKGRHYEHARMGIKIDLPEKVAATINIATGSIDVRTQSEVGGRGSLLFVHTGGRRMEEILSGGPTSWSRVVYGQYDDWLRSLVGQRLKVVNNRRFDIPIGDGRMREWAIAGTDPFHVSAVFVPACSGRAAFYFLLTWQEEADRVLLEKWMRAFRLLRGPELPICEEMTDD
jgi:hypothetical protein